MDRDIFDSIEIILKLLEQQSKNTNDPSTFRNSESALHASNGPLSNAIGPTVTNVSRFDFITKRANTLNTRVWSQCRREFRSKNGKKSVSPCTCWTRRLLLCPNNDRPIVIIIKLNEISRYWVAKLLKLQGCRIILIPFQSNGVSHRMRSIEFSNFSRVPPVAKRPPALWTVIQSERLEVLHLFKFSVFLYTFLHHIVRNNRTVTLFRFSLGLFLLLSNALKTFCLPM